MTASGIKSRLSIIRLMVAFVVLASLLVMIYRSYKHRTYRQDIVLEVVDPDDRTEIALKTLAQQSITPAILAAALADRRLSGLPRLQHAKNPQAELQRMASAYVTSVEGGLFSIYAESDSEEEAIAIAQAVTDAYLRDQGPSRLKKWDVGFSGLSNTSSTLDLPWKLAVATVLALVASASVLVFPLRWLSPARFMRPLVASYRSSPRRFLNRSLITLAAIPPGLLVLSFLGFFPWSGVNCLEDEIDINSGRIRKTFYLLWVPVQRSVTDSALTKAVAPETGSGSKADWQPVVTLSPGLHYSPHYRFHGAIHQIRELELCWEAGKMTAAARRETAKNVLHLWRQTGRYHRAGEYIESVWELARQAEDSGHVVDLAELPAP